jgi:hypothetical protein
MHYRNHKGNKKSEKALLTEIERLRGDAMRCDVDVVEEQ